MIMESSVPIAAPAALVWDVFSDVERWSTWTASIERIAPLDGAGLAVGRRFAIKQPWLPDLVWQVDEVVPGRTWTWSQRAPGGTTTALHEVIAQGPEQTLVRQRLEQRGPVGSVVALVLKRMTRRYLQLEADGLRAASESRWRRRAASA